MKLENQCCTIEQGKKLKELGITVPSVIKYFDSSVGICLLYTIESEDYLSNEWYAYTVAELGAMLPERCNTRRSTDIYEIEVGSVYCMSDRIGETPRCYANTEAQSRASMLIYLLENNIVTAEECNMRLQQA